MASAQTLTEQEVVVKLWEAREQLEAEALEKESAGGAAPASEAIPTPAAVPAPAPQPESVVAKQEDTQESQAAEVSQPAPVVPKPEGHTPNLMSPEVTAGLERLLSEWPSFKGSGILGFGPGGLSHPTFKRLADIPVRYVLTGRFDEPDPDLIAEIREYVGGWRREQGVEPGEDETFEQYLRRVIAKILDTRAAIDARTNDTTERA